jgi:L-asparagine oxygenase
VSQSVASDELIPWSRKVIPSIERDGFVFCKKVAPHLSTLDVACHLGLIVEIEKILPRSQIPTVQSLIPRTATDVGKNQYSGNYGLDAFPLHTDLAHWFLPPRYFILRCIVGSADVVTNLLVSEWIADHVGRLALQKAVFRVRRHRHGSSGLLRALSRFHQQELFRWDPIFLEPANTHAITLQHVMEGSAYERVMISVRLEDSGDTLFVDNWRLLHGRSAVPLGSSRHIERVYLSR